MISFTNLIRRQARVGTTTALAWGLITGFLSGYALISIENANLILPTSTARLYALVFFTCLSPVLAAALLIPVELGVAALLRWTGIRTSPARLYCSVLTIGFLFLLVVFWLGFNVIRNSKSLAATAVYAVSALGSVALLIAVNRIMLPNPDRQLHGFNVKVLVIAMALCLGFTAVSYRLLAVFPQLTGSQTGPENSQAKLTLPSLRTSFPNWNVLLISIDTLRADHLSCYGYSRATSPQIDTLAKEGVLFLGAHSQAPWTLPSHATMLTSLYPSTHGARFSSQHAPILDKLDSSYVTLAEMLQASGYKTAGFTSSFWLSKQWGISQGFDDFQMNPNSNASFLVDAGVHWMASHQSHPFFLFLHFFDVHNYESPSEFFDRYANAGYDGSLKDSQMLTSRNAYTRLSNADLAYMKARYDGAITYVDQQLGRLLEWLRSSGLYDKTLIIITSDHGEEFWEHGGTGHGFTLYEEAISVPLILKPAENRTPQQTIREPVGLIDIPPTILSYLKLPVPPFLEGISFKPLTEGRPVSRLTLFAEDTYYMNSVAILRGGYKYIENRIPPSELLNPALAYVNLRSFFRFRRNELYRIDNDPGERFNLLQSEPEHTLSMRKDLLTHVRIENVGEREQMDEKTREQLRSIGYLQ